MPSFIPGGPWFCLKRFVLCRALLRGFLGKFLFSVRVLKQILDKLVFFRGDLVALDGSRFLHICGWLCYFGVVSMLLQSMFVCWVSYPGL